MNIPTAWPEDEPRPLRATLLDEAASLTCDARDAAYGDPVAMHRTIAAIFNAATGRDLSAREAALFMSCVKMARRARSPSSRDSYVDGAAYAAIEYECAKSE